MSLRHSGKQGFVSLLLVVSLMVAGGSVWAAHDCCGHPSGSPEEADPGTRNVPDDDCVCTCCQAETAISPISGVPFHFDSWLSVERIALLAVSRFETDVFRPPLA